MVRCIAIIFSVAAFGQTQLDYATRIKNKPVVDNREYAFSVRPAVGDLSLAGSNTVTLSPVPTGVNGTNTNHYLYISGGAGTAEAVLITGGTAIGGAATGTVTFTTANAHTGDWRVGTATGGIQEALYSQALYVPAQVQVSASPVTLDIYAPITMPLGSSITGPKQVSGYSYILSHVAGGGSTIRALGSNIIENVYMAAESGQLSWAISVLGSRGVINNVFIDSFRAGGIDFPTEVFDWYVTDTQIVWSLYPTNTVAGTIGISMQGSGVGANNIWFRGIKIIASGATTSPLAGVMLRSGAGLFFTDCYIASMGNGVYIGPNSAGQFVSNVKFNSVDIDAGTGDGLTIEPVHASTFIYAISFIGGKLLFNSGNGVVIGSVGHTEDILIQNSTIVASAQHGILLAGGDTSRIAIKDNRIYGNAYGGTSYSGIGAYGTNPVVEITGNIIGHGFLTNPIDGFGLPIAETQQYALSLGGGAGTSWIIKDNDLSGNLIGPVVSLPTGAGLLIKDNLGVDNVFGTVAAGTSVTLTVNSRIYVTGTTAIATMLGGWAGREVSLIFTNASPGGVTTGGNIAKAVTASQNQVLACVFDGTSWYCK